MCVIQGVSSRSPKSDSQHLLLCLGLTSANEAGFSLFDPVRFEGDGRAAQRKARGEPFVTADGAFLSPQTDAYNVLIFYSRGKTASLRVF